MKHIRYYTPEFKEFVIGFKFQSEYFLFSDDGEWRDAEITKDNIEEFESLYVNDASPVEFRALKR